MKCSLGFLLAVLPLFFASATFAQLSVPDIPYDSAPNLLKLPDGVYLGEVAGVATNSKGHVFVYHAHGLEYGHARHEPRFCAHQFAPAGIRPDRKVCP